MIRYILSLATVAMCTTSYGQSVAAENDSEAFGSGGLNLQLAPTVPENIRIRSSHGAEFDPETGKARYREGLQVFTDSGIQLFADRALLDTKKKEVQLNGNVRIYQGGVLHRGEKATYNYENDDLDTSGLRSGLGPILLDSDSFTAETVNGKRVFVGHNAGITTHDRKRPDYWLRADQINIYPDEKVVFRDLKLYVNETPVFWLPYLSQPVDEQLGYHFVPGSRSHWGAFLLNSYGVMLGGEVNELTGDKEDQWLLSEWKFDLRAKRGVAAGVNFSDVRLEDNSNLMGLKFYFAHDEDPELSRTGLPRANVSDERYTIGLSHRVEWPQATDAEYLFDANLSWISDRYYLEDFDPRAYNTNNQPDNIIGFQKRTADYQLGAFTRFQLNDFYLSDTRLPELYFDQVKRPLLGSKFLHESVSSMGIYREELGDYDAAAFRAEALLPGLSQARQSELSRLLAPNKFVRFHTYHELSYPMTLAEGLSLTPRAGAGYSQYWNDDVSNSDHGSPHFYVGVDAAMKFTKTYSDAQSRRWGVNELLHVVQPYANLSVLSTKELSSSNSKIDRLTATERPRSFDVARYSAIDDYRDWSIVRLGARNQLLTKRDGRSHSWFSMDTYVDTFLDDPEFDRNFSNLYNELHWDPVPWWSLSLNTQFPMSAEGFTEVSTSMNFLPHEDLELDFGHSYLEGHPVIQDSNLIHGRANLRLSHRWGLGAYQQWQLEDSTLERQEYSVSRNFESWTLGLGVFQRDNRLKNEYGVLLNISLNAVPSANLPFSLGTQ